MPLPQRAPVQGKARLTLAINDDTYRLFRLNPHPEVADRAWRLWKVEVGSPSDDHYDVSVYGGEVECTCPDFVWCRQHKDPKGCKHIAALVAVGLLGD